MSARDRDVSKLHPAFRERHLDLLGRVADRKLSIEPFELWRDPARQVELYAEGRAPGVGRPGHHSTYERAWESNHQHGFAEDWVWWFDGKWSWDPPADSSWDEFYELVAAAELEHLEFEKPHVQLPGFRARGILNGTAVYPPGDDAWEENLDAAIAAWGRQPRTDRYGFEQPGAPRAPAARPAEPAPTDRVWSPGNGIWLPASPFGT
jgi:hypothetical protein